MFQERLAAGSAYHGFIAMAPSIPSAILGTVRPFFSYEHLYELSQMYSRGAVRVEPSFKWCKNPSQIMWEDRYWLRGKHVTRGPRCKTERSGQSRGHFPIPEMKIRNPLTDGRTDCHVGKRRRSEKRKDGRRKELRCTQRRREKMDGNAGYRLDIVMECRTQEMNSSPRSPARVSHIHWSRVA